MDKKQDVQKHYLINSAIADIAINDLGLTLDEPAFFSPYCSYVEYGIDSEFGNIIRFQNLCHMSYHLCMLDNGIELAKKLAKNSGLLNYQLSDTEYVTEEFIENGIKNGRKLFSSGEAVNCHFELSIHYENLFRSYCLANMGKYGLNERIRDKIETYLKR